MTKLQPNISIIFDGIIWRLEIDPIKHILFAEIRNEKDKQVSFASIDLQSAEVYFKDLANDERWLSGIEAGHDGVLLLHNYSSANTPLHKGIIAIDAITGQTLWANYNWTFDHMGMEGPVVYDSRIQPRKLFTIDIKTAGILAGHENNIRDNEVALPELIDTTLLQSQIDMPGQLYGNIAHNLYYKDFRIVSLHTLNSNKLIQSLYIFKSGRQVFYDLLNTNIQKLQPEAFVLHQQYLIYLKNQVELNVINLLTE